MFMDLVEAIMSLSQDFEDDPPAVPAPCDRPADSTESTEATEAIARGYMWGAR